MADDTTAANLPREARALLDAIAQGESGPTARAEGISPYFILYGGGSFESLPDRVGYNGFPDWPGKDNSHAAGRYQFEPATWKGIVQAFPANSTPNFRTSGDQDWGAWFLAKEDFHSRTGAELLATLQAGNLSTIGSSLQPTWTSLSDATFPERYNAALALLPVSPPSPLPSPPAPSPAPLPPAPPAPTPAPVNYNEILADLKSRRDQLNMKVARLNVAISNLEAVIKDFTS